MDPRFTWSSQGQPNAQYPPQPPNGFPYQQNGYPMQFAPQQVPVPMAYSQSQSQSYQPQSQPIVAPPPSQQTHANSPPPPRSSQPQVVIPQRNPTGMPQFQTQNQRIRQVQVPVQRAGSGQGQPSRTSSGGANTGNGIQSSPRPSSQQAQISTPKSLKKQSQWHQDNGAHLHQRTPDTPYRSHNQYRAPLHPQPTPNQRPPSQTHTPSSQHRSPSSSSQPSSQFKTHPQVVIKKPAERIHTPTRPQHAPSKALPADLAVLLLSAADEYLIAAHNIGSIASMGLRESDRQQYYRLIATALGCMESVLKKYNLYARDEAKLRLRYASILVEETDNTFEIDEVLMKGIALCKRHHLSDLNYAMMHLHARYQFKSNHRVALKSLDKCISDAETYQHIVWVYAFRFLKISLALQISGRPETASVLQQLHTIANHAEGRGDRAIFVTCSTIEALVHLRSHAPDHLEQTQRAIAAARSQQLQTTTRQLGQIDLLLDTVDLACSILQGRPNADKLKAYQAKSDGEGSCERADGVFTVLIEKSFGGNSTFATGGVFQKTSDGRDELVFAWLPRDLFKTMAFYLSGMIMMSHEKGSQYLRGGYGTAGEILAAPSLHNITMPASIAHRNWLKVLQWNLQFSIGVASCYLEDRSNARKALKALQSRVADFPFQNHEQYTRTLSYLSAVYDQSAGSLDSALAKYSEPIFHLPDAGTVSNPVKTDIAILAAMNRLLIVRNPSHPENHLASALYAQLDSLCSSHPNAYIKCAFRLIRAITAPDHHINRQKSFIQLAAQESQKINNPQLVAMSLNYMASRFFVDQVGEKPVKSVKAARIVSKQLKGALWKAVAYGLCVSTFQANGLVQDAQACRNALEELRGELLPVLKGEQGISDHERDVVKMEE